MKTHTSRFIDLIAVGITFALAICITPLLPGCGTTGAAPGSTNSVAYITPDRVEKVAALGAFGAVLAQPDKREAFVAAHRGLDALIASERWDITAASAAFSQSGGIEITSDEGKLMLGAAPLFVDAFLPGSVDLKQSAYARAVIIGTNRGLLMALGSTTHSVPSRGPAGVDPAAVLQLSILKAQAQQSRTRH